VQLLNHLRGFLFEGKILLAVVGTFAQHKGFNDAAQHLG
jgi:hypothetical protein